jgi:predicted molibdopterin-dependent oxidoreductase YjgC
VTESLSFDGTVVTFRPGQTIGAALLASGTRSWRTTRRNGRLRGLFCGIGVCFDCLLTVDGIPDQRACLVEARDGMQVRTQQGVGRAGLAV